MVKLQVVKPEIIFEDASLIVLDKPAGWITNSASTTSNQPVVQDWLAKNFQFSIFKFPELRNGIVHRLDKETSGLLLIAKTKDAFENLQSQFKERKVQKKYTALVHGEVEPKEGKIEISVGRLPWRRDRFGVLPGGREAETRYRVVSNFQFSISHEKFTLIELEPKTGRTHQIRIHAKYLGHPLVSDEFYAGRKTARKDRKWCPRLFLHASEISFIHPERGNEVKFESKLTSDLQIALDSLEKLH